MADSFGRYTLLKSLGVGGMASIHLASLTSIGGFEKLLAIKKIFPHLSQSEEFIDMLIAEARIAVELNHPNISQIYDLGEVSGQYFIAMEYIHGRDVYHLISRCAKAHRAIPLPLACFVTRQILCALGHAHAKRDLAGRPMHIVHRDVSPRNILISYDGAVKLIDFGIAKATTVDQHTQAGLIKGKLSYMSPEQARCEPVDSRSDLFATGLVLYELIHLNRLFGGRSDICTLEQVRACRLPPFRAVNPSLPEALERILLRALAPDRTQRYQTAQEFDDDLQRFLLASGALPNASDLAAFMEACFSEEIAAEAGELRRLTRSTGVKTGGAGPRLDAMRQDDALPDDLSLILDEPRAAGTRLQAPPQGLRPRNLAGGPGESSVPSFGTLPQKRMSRSKLSEIPPPPWERQARLSAQRTPPLAPGPPAFRPLSPPPDRRADASRPSAPPIARLSPRMVAAIVTLAAVIAILVSHGLG